MKFVFFGTAEFSVIVLARLIKSGFIPSLIVTVPDKPAKRGLKLTSPPIKLWAKKNNIPFIQPSSLKDPATLYKLKTMDYGLRTIDYELFIIATYGKIIPKDYLVLPRYGSINIHPSLLL